MNSSKPLKQNSFLTVLLVFAGCAQPAPVHERPQQASFGVPGGVDVGSTLAVYPGPLDLENRYLSNVLLYNITATAIPGGCSGVLATPRKVITAAHCVCAKREITASDREKIEKQLDRAAPFNIKTDKGKRQLTDWKSNILGNTHTLTDASSCLARPMVLVIGYLEPPAPPVRNIYQASAVRPHPRFLSMDDNEDKGLFREADLAIVHLEQPVTQSVRSIKLPTAEIRLNEDIIMVGYGPGETHYPKTTFGFRHFGESKVTHIDRFASGGMRFTALEQPNDGGTPSRIQAGDSGGGGFSKADDTLLLGIVSARSEERGSIFESVYPYREWLEEEMNAGL